MFGKWGEISWKRENRLTMDGRWLGRRSERKTHQADPTNPTGTIRHDRQSVVWLVEPAWKAIVTLLWVAPGGRLSLSLSLSRSICLSLSLSAAAPPSRSSETETERVSEGKDRRRERKDKRRDRDAYNYLSFYIREPGRFSQPVVLFLASAFARLSSQLTEICR